MPDLNYHERSFDKNCKVAVKEYIDKYNKYDKLKASVRNIFSAVLESPNRYIAFPFSFNHPMHVLVTEACLDVLEDLGDKADLNRVIIYIDHPYDFQNAGNGLFMERRNYLFGRLKDCLKKTKGFVRCYHSESNQSLLKPVMKKLYGENHYGEFGGASENTACSCFVTKEVLGKLKKLITHNVLFVTAQSAPFYSAGGLGSVAKTYTAAASEFLNDIRIIMPLYHFETEKNAFKYTGNYKNFEEYIKAKNNITEKDYNKIDFGDGIIEYCILMGYNSEKDIDYPEGTTYYFVDIKESIRDDGKPSHKFFSSEDKYDAHDVAAFCMVIKHALLGSGLPGEMQSNKSKSSSVFQPNIIHCNDYQTGLIPYLLKLDGIKSFKTIFTIHCGGYEGIFSSKETLDLLRVSRTDCRRCIACVLDDADEVNGVCPLTEIDVHSAGNKKELGLKPQDYTISCLKAGIRCADKVSTTSEGYAKTLMSYGDKYDGIKVTGIRNGIPIQYEKWDRVYKSFKSFDSDDIQKNICEEMLKPNAGDKIYDNERKKVIDYNFKNKTKCKELLQHDINIISKSTSDYKYNAGEFSVNPDIPLFCMVSRLTPVKGIDQIKNIAQYIAKENMQLVIVGDDEVAFDAQGNKQDNHLYGGLFKTIAKTSKGRIFYMEFSKMKEHSLSEHKIYAGSDFVLMPSLDESCGTTQILAMKYGGIPIVTSIESFKDTVLNYNVWDGEINSIQQGIGFFTHKDACWTLLSVIKRVIKEYGDYKAGKGDAEKFKKMILKNFGTDFSWRMGSMVKYIELYNSLL